MEWRERERREREREESEMDGGEKLGDWERRKKKMRRKEKIGFSFFRNLKKKGFWAIFFRFLNFLFFYLFFLYKILMKMIFFEQKIEQKSVQFPKNKIFLEKKQRRKARIKLFLFLVSNLFCFVFQTEKKKRS